MKTNIYWTCRVCGSSVPGECSECPNCKKSAAKPRNQAPDFLPLSRKPHPEWARPFSVLAPVLGLVAFFLPWLQVSCGPIKMSISGYEIATGELAHKYDQSSSMGSTQAITFRDQTPGKHGKSQREGGSGAAKEATPSPPPAIPLLWVVPGSSLLLALLALAGLPRAPAFAIASLASAYLAYFLVTTEAEINQSPLSVIIDHQWSIGIWTSAVGLIVPLAVTLFPSNWHQGGT